ncbi:histidine--tRNA ligase [Candidatus Daviesbacteria bacterium]|nr:histidine--tRNA ligase [Candidatus Daviesbacteria bacterium]
MNKIKAQTLKGFRDFLPRESRKRQFVINKLKSVFESFGFEPLETPALEYEEVLLGKYGEEGDKLMYRFTDNGGRKVALRYDQTVPLARVVAQYQNQLPIPFKRYQIQPVWRAENPQKGRFREFLQCDIDTVGTNSPLADVEIIATVVESLKQLGFKNFKIIINDRNIFSMMVKRGVVPEKDLTSIIRSIDKLKKIGREGVLNELIEKGYGSEKATYIVQQIEYFSPTENLQQIFTYLEKFGIPSSVYKFSPTLARGLDYYTGMIFEVEVEGYTVGSVGGGGRFDNLIGIFADKQIPAVGFAFGFDRIVEAMTELNLFPADLATVKVLVTVFPARNASHSDAGGSKEFEQKSIEVCSQLRSNNINTELWLDPETKLEKQLKYADQKGIPYVVIIGPEEAESNKVTLKNLASQTQDKLITLDEAIRRIQSAE